jgi:hypothetical protein
VYFIVMGVTNVMVASGTRGNLPTPWAHFAAVSVSPADYGARGNLPTLWALFATVNVSPAPVVADILRKVMVVLDSINNISGA